MLRLVGRNGEDVATIRETIAVSPAIERTLLAYADEYPEERGAIVRILAFRNQVAEEFRRLLAKRGLDVGRDSQEIGAPLSQGA